jgi:aminoglycoside phosphotransferase
MTTFAEARTSLAAAQALVGDDLWMLIEAVGSPLVDLLAVTTIPPAEAYRACFRLIFAEGPVLKGRRLRATADVERITYLSSLLDHQYFPPILAHRGQALLTRWIPGRPAAASDWTADLVRTCGQLQGSLHRLSLSPAMAALRRRPNDWDRRLHELLADLVAHGVLDTGQAQQAHRLAGLHAPVAASVGLCHTDFCAENMIITQTGHVCIVDNEGISIDACEYDLARTWYRWPMTEHQQRWYAEGYGRHDHLADFAAHFLHWALLAVIESAAFRVRSGAVSARVPLARLRRLLRTRGGAETFPYLLGRA